MLKGGEGDRIWKWKFYLMGTPFGVRFVLKDPYGVRAGLGLVRTMD